MNNLQYDTVIENYNTKDFIILDHDILGSVKVVEYNNNIWFNLRDIIISLGIKKYNIIKHKINEHTEVITVVAHNDDNNCDNHVKFISESSVYTFLLYGDTYKCDLFKNWLSYDILPSLKAYEGFNEQTLMPVITTNMQMMKEAFETGSYNKSKDVFDDFYSDVNGIFEWNTVKSFTEKESERMIHTILNNQPYPDEDSIEDEIQALVDMAYPDEDFE